MHTFKQQTVGSFCFLLTFFLGLAVLASPFSFAAEQGHSLGAHVGHVWPAGNLGKTVDNTIAPGLFYEYNASDVFALQASWTRSRHTATRLAVDSYAVGIKTNFVYYDKLVPYGIIGMGLYDVSKEFGGPGLTASKLLFGLHGGLGADLELTDTIFTGMAFVFHSMFSGNATLPNGLTQDLSGRWCGFFFRGGLHF